MANQLTVTDRRPVLDKCAASDMFDTARRMSAAPRWTNLKWRVYEVTFVYQESGNTHVRYEPHDRAIRPHDGLSVRLVAIYQNGQQLDAAGR